MKSLYKYQTKLIRNSPLLTKEEKEIVDFVSNMSGTGRSYSVDSKWDYLFSFSQIKYDLELKIMESDEYFKTLKGGSK